MQEKKLNLIPSGDMPVIYASQYDKNRVIRFNLFEGEDEYTLTGTEIVKCNIRKNDEHIVVITPTIGANKYIDIYLTEQACACFGSNIGEITISSDEDTLIGTINFILEVERNPIQGGVTSASDIADLESQIEDIVHEVMSDDYYTRDEVDAKLDLKADASSVYTKSEVDTALASKANASDVYTKSQVDTALGLKADKSDTYTKTQVDTALALKADSSSVYTKSEVDSALALKANAADVYTKTEVDEIIEVLYPINTASGSIATFSTSLALPLVECKAKIVAQQAGSGTPSPSNPRAISGYDEVVLTHTGKNLFNGTFYASAAYSDADFNTGTVNAKQKSIKLWLGAGTYTISFGGSNSMRIIRELFDGGYSTQAYQDLFSYTFTTTQKGYVGLSFRREDNENWEDVNIQIEKGSTATAYETYNAETKTVTLPSTIYGGVLDVITGKLMVTSIGHIFDGGESFTTIDNNKYLYNFGQKVQSSYSNYSSTKCSHFKVGGYGGWSQVLPNEYLIAGTYYIGVNPDMTLSDYKVWLADQANNGMPVVATATLQTPIEITGLTPANFTTIAGEQNIFADCGDISVSFKQGIQEYIDAKIAETQALIL